jgi:diamine N-acetyltransferase
VPRSKLPIMDLTIRRLTLPEAPILASFAEACFREAFSAHFDSDSLNAVCAVAFTLPVMEKLVLDGVWVAGDWQGYLALGEVSCPIPQLESPAAELARLYVPADWQGKGIADQLLDRFLDEVTARRARSVWLQAYAGNPRALSFYRRRGFTDFGSYQLVCEGVVLPHRLLGRAL